MIATLIMMSTAIQWETAAFAYGEEELSDVELVFVLEQPQQAVSVESAPLQQQQTRNAAKKRQRNGDIF